MKGHTEFLEGFDKNRGGKAFREPVTEGCFVRSFEIRAMLRRTEMHHSLSLLTL